MDPETAWHIDQALLWAQTIITETKAFCNAAYNKHDYDKRPDVFTLATALLAPPQCVNPTVSQVLGCFQNVAIPASETGRVRSVASSIKYLMESSHSIDDTARTTKDPVVTHNISGTTQDLNFPEIVLQMICHNHTNKSLVFPRSVVTLCLSTLPIPIARFIHSNPPYHLQYIYNRLVMELKLQNPKYSALPCPPPTAPARTQLPPAPPSMQTTPPSTSSKSPRTTPSMTDAEVEALLTTPPPKQSDVTQQILYHDTGRVQCLGVSHPTWQSPNSAPLSNNSVIDLFGSSTDRIVPLLRSRTAFDVEMLDLTKINNKLTAEPSLLPLQASDDSTSVTHVASARFHFGIILKCDETTQVTNLCLLSSLVMTGSYGYVLPVTGLMYDNVMAKITSKEIPTADAIEDHAFGLMEESNILLRLRHPNIIACFAAYLCTVDKDTDTTDDTYPEMDDSLMQYFENLSTKLVYHVAMMEQALCTLGDLYSNTTIHSALVKQPSLVYFFELDAFTALSYIHSMGITHCDIKPANLLIVRTIRRPVCKIGDFGSAQRPVSKVIHGTYAFMAPEMLFLKQGCYNSDIWSCALTFYCYYTRGQYLFNSRSSLLDISEQTSNIAKAVGFYSGADLNRAWDVFPELQHCSFDASLSDAALYIQRRLLAVQCVSFPVHLFALLLDTLALYPTDRLSADELLLKYYSREHQVTQAKPLPFVNLTMPSRICMDIGFNARATLVTSQYMQSPVDGMHATNASVKWILNRPMGPNIEIETQNTFKKLLVGARLAACTMADASCRETMASTSNDPRTHQRFTYVRNVLMNYEYLPWAAFWGSTGVFKHSLWPKLMNSTVPYQCTVVAAEDNRYNVMHVEPLRVRRLQNTVSADRFKALMKCGVSAYICPIFAISVLTDGWALVTQNPGLPLHENMGIIQAQPLKYCYQLLKAMTFLETKLNTSAGVGLVGLPHIYLEPLGDNKYRIKLKAFDTNPRLCSMFYRQSVAPEIEIHKEGALKRLIVPPGVCFKPANAWFCGTTLYMFLTGMPLFARNDSVTNAEFRDHAVCVGSALNDHTTCPEAPYTHSQVERVSTALSHAWISLVQAEPKNRMTIASFVDSLAVSQLQIHPLAAYPSNFNPGEMKYTFIESSKSVVHIPESTFGYMLTTSLQEGCEFTDDEDN